MKKLYYNDITLKWAIITQCLVLVLFSNACMKQPIIGKANDYEFQEIIPEGFSAFPSLRTFDGPGTLIRINEHGEKYFVEELKFDQNKINAGEETFPEFHMSTNKSNENYMRLFDLSAPGKDTNIKLMYDDISFVDYMVNLGGAIRERVSENVIEQALNEYFREIVRNKSNDFTSVSNRSTPGAIRSFDIKDREKSSYYVICETISVKNIKYKLIERQSFSPELSFNLNSWVDLNSNLRWENESKWTIISDFNVPHRIFYKTLEFSVVTNDSFSIKPKTARWNTEPTAQEPILKIKDPIINPISLNIVHNINSTNYHKTLDSLRKIFELRSLESLEYGKTVQETPTGTYFRLPPYNFNPNWVVPTEKGSRFFEIFKISENDFLIVAFTTSELAASISRLDGIKENEIPFSPTHVDNFNCIVLIPYSRIKKINSRKIPTTDVGDLRIIDVVIK